MNGQLNVNETKVVEERKAPSAGGMMVFSLNSLLMIAALGLLIASFVWLDGDTSQAWMWALMVITLLYLCVIGPFFYAGLKVLKPNEALVLTLFGKYFGTLRGPGFFFVNPFSSAFNPAYNRAAAAYIATAAAKGQRASGEQGASGTAGSGSELGKKKISLKVMTLNNDKQKINDQLGNPIIIGIAVIWKVVNTAKAVFNVDNYMEYLSIQCDAALRGIVRLYPYDNTSDTGVNPSSDDEAGEKTLRGSSQEIAEKLREEIQSRVDAAGLEILEARITTLSYAPEIAAVMLQRQQASAVIAARQMIVDGAVGMVEMALTKLNDKRIVNLDEERKAAMVSNLLVVLCSNKETGPVINTGSLY